MSLSKKADVPITALVFMVLVLVGASLFIYNSNLGKVSEEITDSRILNEIYYKENLIDFYIYDILDRTAARGIQKSKLIEDIKKEMNKYVSREDVFVRDEMKILIEQVSENNVEISDDFVSVSLNLKIELNKGNIVGVYSSEKKYVKDF
ncbi:hypothetical protein GF386_03050 [Candidatus Pacearchaeota archaeon]|nr:hypothetical protein [Candidatus Pacearchaeota archaeon]MBD3283117.1 hypothetical protein [Candidatus Pacearchaeota archaeon]